MKIVIAKETHPDDPRVPIVPSGIKKLAEVGAEVEIETGLGSPIGFADEDYQEVGASVVQNVDKVLSEADMVLRLKKPELKMVEKLKPEAVLVSFLDPFNERELLEKLASQKISAISMEMIPRTTLAQKMDALSSQANLAGYVAVILAAESLTKIFPMMTTPSGTISPSRVFVIGAGVAGLQAIATAKRLGAIVEAYDTRPAVEEQVRSLGGRFVRLDIGETGETEQGYARELTEEQLERQRESMARHCEKSDVVITTAQVFGRKAPRIVTADMVSRMRPGSVIVDLAVESGGNVEGSEAGKMADRGGVKIIGYSPLPAQVPYNASEMYSNNITSLVTHFWDQEAKEFILEVEDEIIQGALVVHGGEICHEMLKKEGQ